MNLQGAPVGGNAWLCTFSQEVDGGDGSCGPIGTGGLWYSELSTVPLGTASDFAALGRLPCGTVLNMMNASGGPIVQASKRDVGAGSGFLPVGGVYPATAAALQVSGGQYQLIIWRADGLPMRPVRGTPVPTPAGGATGVRPGRTAAQPADSGQTIDKIFSSYQQELGAPRTAPQSSFASVGQTGWTAPFKWWWQSFSDRWSKERTGQ